MDRTVIAPWKAEEKELSEKLYKKLLGLTLLHPATEDFRKCVNEEMFLKPNQRAFFQVMHYLFKLIDSVEFKKRFYWPIQDKRAEANFRSSTIDYLKYLNEKHQLHWTNIKSYLVVMPGGMKFINFLLDLVGFVVQEQIKQREKYLSSDVEAGQVSELNMKRMRKQNDFFKEYASAYISDADGQIIKLKEKTDSIRIELRQIATTTGLEAAILMDDYFYKEFDAENRELFTKRYSQPAVIINLLDKPLALLKKTMDTFQIKEAEFKVDNDIVHKSLIEIQKVFPTHMFVADKVTQWEGVVKMDCLLTAFNCVHMSIEEQLTAVDEMPRSSYFVTNNLAKLQIELQQIEGQITNFQKKLNSNMKKRTSEQKIYPGTPMRGIATLNINDNSLFAKFVATPPIKLEMLEENRNSNKRLPFLDDLYLNAERSIAVGTKAGMDSLNNLLTVPRSARKLNNSYLSFDFSNTANKSKIIDSVQLLRTINKETTKGKIQAQHNLSAMGSTWKERQCLFGKDINATPASVSYNSIINEKSIINKTSEHMHQIAANATLVSSPFTPFNSNELTRIARSQLLDSSVGGGSFLYSKKLCAVKKVQDASLCFQNLSTSPSGRLDSLVTVEAKDVPKLLLNDMNITDSASFTEDFSSVSSNKYLKPSLKFSTKNQENNENDLNISNSHNFIFSMACDESEAELFDISDSVLKDVIM